MEVNVTLILQALQFACAYYFLYTYLFAPACKLLDADEQAKNELYKKLEREQQIKDALLHDYHVKNNAFKGVLLREIPMQATQTSYQESMFGPTLYHIELDQLSQLDREKTELFLVDRLSQVIKK